VGRILARVALESNTFRIIPSQFPPIRLFESCLKPSELEAAYELESLTNDRLQDLAGDLKMVSEQDRVSGPGSTVIMASFTHYGQKSRFTNGDFGVYYAALDLETAIQETRFWQERLLQDTNEPEMMRDMRVYCSKTQPDIGFFVDLRDDALAHQPSNYAYSQAKAVELRNAGEFGVYYRSVRNLGGECIAVFRPAILGPAIQSKHLRYYWDGKRINRIEEVRSYPL